jgi:hypothetical protein
VLTDRIEGRVGSVDADRDFMASLRADRAVEAALDPEVNRGIIVVTGVGTS